MRKILGGLALALGLFVAACGTVPTETFNDKVAIGVQTATAVRKAATQLMVADKLTVVEDAAIQAKVSSAVYLLRTAKAVQQSDPAKATAILAQALAELEAAKATTGAPS